MMIRKTFLLSLITGLSLAMPGYSSAGDTDPACDAKRLKILGKFNRCVMKELINSFDIPKGDFDADFTKCDAKFDQGMQKTDAKAVQRGLNCPAVDAETVKQDLKDLNTVLYDHVRFGDPLPAPTPP